MFRWDTKETSHVQLEFTGGSFTSGKNVTDEQVHNPKKDLEKLQSPALAPSALTAQSEISANH